MKIQWILSTSMSYYFLEEKSCRKSLETCYIVFPLLCSPGHGDAAPRPGFSTSCTCQVLGCCSSADPGCFLFPLLELTPDNTCEEGLGLGQHCRALAKAQGDIGLFGNKATRSRHEMFFRIRA